jgi:putative NIF3 family GTP cyclohydrolase 1 type 2
MSVHSYEEVAYEWYPILNSNQFVGAGIVGDLPSPISSSAFLNLLKKEMNLEVIKYTPISKNIQRVSICGGSGQFLIEDAKRSNSDAYVTSDIKYHEFFDAEDQLMLCDIGHYESEKFTIDLLYDILREKFSTFAIQKTRVDTNPIKYFQ